MKKRKLSVLIPNLERHREWIKKEAEDWAAVHLAVRNKSLAEASKATMPSLIEPRPKDLEEAIGLERRDHVIFIAGGIGGFAKSLAKRHYVEFTDANKIATENMSDLVISRAEPAEEFSSSTVNYGKEITKKRPVIVSLEPYPILKTPSSALLALLRSMALGRKIVLFDHIAQPEHRFANPTLSFINKIRGVLTQEYKVELEHAFHKLSGNKVHEFSVSKILVPREASVKAWIDLNVIYALQDKEKVNGKDLAKRLGITQKELKESVRRISLLLEKLGEYSKIFNSPEKMEELEATLVKREISLD